jgi:hypothetical protein
MPQHPYNRMSLKHRVQASAKLVQRARKQGRRQAVVSVMGHPLLHLGPSPKLDGLTLYRRAVEKLVVPPQVGQSDGRTILLISHC